MLAYNTQPLEDLHLLAAKTDPPTRFRLLRCFILRTSASTMHSVCTASFHGGPPPPKSLQTAKPLRLPSLDAPGQQDPFRLPSLDAYGQHFPHLC